MNEMAAEVSIEKMPLPAPPKSNISFESQKDITMKPDVAVAVDKPSESTAPPSPGSSRRSLKKYRPFTLIPSFSGPRDVKGKPEVTSLEGIDMSTEPPKVFADKDVLSKHQLSISQWPAYTSFNSATIDQSTSPNSTKSTHSHQHIKHGDILDYVYDWAAWAAEIPNEARREEVLGWVMKTLEQVLKSRMERTGMVLEPSDVEGTKTGTKKTLEGDLNIQVIITSSIKEKKRAKTAAATISTEPTVEQLVAIERASRASLTKPKRPAAQFDESDSVQESKRQKLDDEAANNAETPVASATDWQEQPKARERFSRSSPESMSPVESQKRARYLQQIFQPRLNHILKKARLVTTRGKCSKWETIKARLKEAKVGVKYRNLMLHDFHEGHEAWNGDNDIDPNEELAHYAQHGFEGALDQVPAGKANNADASVEEERAEEHAEERNHSGTAALLSTIESLPAFNADTPIPDGFVPARPVSSKLLLTLLLS